jgi:DNA-binding IclR family transcriptional regulator
MSETAGNSLERMLGLLDLFSVDQPVWSTEAMMQATGCTRSTCYRYLKVLQAAGFLTPVAQGAYILGPRIIELDRQQRLRDPIYMAGGPPMKQLASRTGHSTLLCMLYSDTVMCVREEISPNAPTGLFSRGQKRPLFHGAASKVIMAHLPPIAQPVCQANGHRGPSRFGRGLAQFSPSHAQHSFARPLCDHGRVFARYRGCGCPCVQSSWACVGQLGAGSAKKASARI